MAQEKNDKKKLQELQTMKEEIARANEENQDFKNYKDVRP
jgi:hypothetical protein